VKPHKLFSEKELTVPQGYYTIEQWNQDKEGTQREWLPILHLPFGALLSAAEHAIEKLGKPGLFRIVQTQRVVWAEEDGGELWLRKSHAGSPEELDVVRKTFERCGGRYPVEEVQAARREAKTNRAALE
jgi:hypothetical protein